MIEAHAFSTPELRRGSRIEALNDNSRVAGDPVSRVRIEAHYTRDCGTSLALSQRAREKPSRDKFSRDPLAALAPPASSRTARTRAIPSADPRDA